MLDDNDRTEVRRLVREMLANTLPASLPAQQPGTVTVAGTTSVSVLLDYDGAAGTAITVANLTGRALLIGDRVMVTFLPPQGVFVTGLITPGPWTLWVPARDFLDGLGGSTFGSGSWANLVAAWLLPNAAAGLEGLTTIPPDWPAGSFTFDIYFQGGGSGNFRFGCQAAAITPGTPGSTAITTGSVATYTVVASYNGLALLTDAIAAVAFAPGDLVNIALSRDGTHGDDSSTNTMYVYGIRLRRV